MRNALKSLIVVSLYFLEQFKGRSQLQLRHSLLLENIFSMVTLRAMEYILSFLLVPYLLRTLGPSQYGAIAFMQGIIGYFTLIINYGFNMTAPRDIACSSEKEWPRLFSAYFWSMVLLWMGSSVVFGLGYLFSHKFLSVALDVRLFFTVYTSVIGFVIFPIWFFQGIQQMRYITILNLTGRMATIVLLFLLVKSSDDYLTAAFLQSCTPMFAGLISWIVLYKIMPGLLQKPNKKEIARVLKEGWQIFISTLAINLYTTSDLVILGALTNNTIVGYYSGADKLINCIKRGISAVNDAVYPYISHLMKDSVSQAFQFLKKQFLVYTICGILGGMLIILFSPRIIPWLLGSKYIPSIKPLQIMGFVPLIVSMSNVLGYETMLPLGMERDFSRVLIMASVLNLTIIVPFINWQQASGVAMAMLITEIFVTLAMGYVLWREKILF